MTFPKNSKEYFHQKTKEAHKDLLNVSNIQHFSFFNKDFGVVIPKIEKVESLDIWLNNVANVFKTAFHLYKFGLSHSIEYKNEIFPDFPLIHFSLCALEAIIYQGAKALQKISDFIMNEDSFSAPEIEMQPLISIS
ncbi:Uncharacterised protein [Legionella wadsworthii]|uniref:Uncharacterized protein n=1 Tax=Legionella wadsworthii TaxID=28088 RepID=A0A378LT60_9GAMM|nr:hypothetical protein [Legionella wadsworthii]STY29038.1 Uncharacterised protein [Legionella wadsworthii]